MPEPINDPAIQSVLDGYRHFQKQHFDNHCDLYKKLVKHGQSPKVLVISCCDSRVDPNTLMQANPGELFVIRNVANLVPTYYDNDHCHSVSAALEFGVCSLHVKHIIILGHRYCGGIQALLDYQPKSLEQCSFVERWIQMALPARDQTLKAYPHAIRTEQLIHCERATLLMSLNNLETFPWIAQRVKEKQLFLHSWYFDLDAGHMYAYSAKKKIFTIL